MTRSGDAAAVSVMVRVSPEDAWDVFTNEIELWWKRGPKFRIAGKKPGRMVIEGGLGGRLFETVELASGPRMFEVGTVRVWEPPRRLELEWRGVNFAPGEKTFVDVTFEALGEGTMVRVRHYGWSALPDDHPVRHGKVGADFSRMIGMWWGELMTSLRVHAAERATSR
jgi:uncharacterized protein YndB with AHSA1/START domain